MRKILFTALVLLAAGLSVANAQTRRALRINEVMVQNDSSVVDDYGNHSAWIELYNSNFAPLEIAKMYITNDRNDLKKYPIPLGDAHTKIAKRQHVIFWADGEPNRGTFHTSFVLTPGKENYIAIVDADGKTIVDEVVIPADLAPNTTYARASDGDGDWEVRRGADTNADGRFDYITPSSDNIIKSSNPKVERFSKEDENGLGLTVIAMGIVFSALLLVCICFYIISKIGARTQRRKQNISAGREPSHRSDDIDHATGEEIAAIVMALHEHLDAHDRESTIVTINKVKKAYSPWNSKIYNMRQVPQLKPRKR